ncbi:hypothetical protein HMPREF0352_0656 [Enterococcus faecium TX1330]|nr:hypothetical protein HMPREF0352_0656 [Enterococcus faecium TX1330]
MNEKACQQETEFFLKKLYWNKKEWYLFAVNHAKIVRKARSSN